MIIYKCTCIKNNKVYIGLTKRSLKQRRYDHEHCASNGSKYYFHNALIKHGFDNFLWEVLYKANDIKELSLLEIYFISLYNSHGDGGYNLTDGGENPPILSGDKNGMFGKTHTNEVKQILRESKIGLSWEERFGEEKAKEIKKKLSKSHTGRKNTPETLKKMSENSYWKTHGHLLKGENNPNYGHKWSDELRKSRSGINSQSYGKGLYGELNGMYGKHHTEEAKHKMSLTRKGSDNGNYKKLENTDEMVKLFLQLKSIGKTARLIGERYDKVKRELILLGFIDSNFRENNPIINIL